MTIKALQMSMVQDMLMRYRICGYMVVYIQITYFWGVTP